MLISLESTEQRAVLTLSFKHYSLKSLDKILQEEHRDSSSGTAPVSHITQHMTKSPRPSPSVFTYCKQSNTGGENGL